MGTGLCNKSMLVLPPVHTLGTTGCHCTRTDQIVVTLCMFQKLLPGTSRVHQKRLGTTCVCHK